MNNNAEFSRGGWRFFGDLIKVVVRSTTESELSCVVVLCKDVGVKSRTLQQ